MLLFNIILMSNKCDSAKCDLILKVFPCGDFFFRRKKIYFLAILSKLNRTSHKRTE